MKYTLLISFIPYGSLPYPFIGFLDSHWVSEIICNERTAVPDIVNERHAPAWEESLKSLEPKGRQGIPKQRIESASLWLGAKQEAGRREDCPWLGGLGKQSPSRGSIPRTKDSQREA